MLALGILHAIQIPLQSKTLTDGIDAGDGAKLAAVYSDPLSADQTAVFCKADELCSDRSDRVTVHTRELCDGLVVGIEPSKQPHEFDVANALHFQPPRRTDLVEVAIQIQLQKIPWIVAGPTGFGGLRAIKTKLAHCQFVDEGIYDAADVVGWHKSSSATGNRVP